MGLGLGGGWVTNIFIMERRAWLKESCGLVKLRFKWLEEVVVTGEVSLFIQQNFPPVRSISRSCFLPHPSSSGASLLVREAVMNSNQLTLLKSVYPPPEGPDCCSNPLICKLLLFIRAPRKAGEVLRAGLCKGAVMNHPLHPSLVMNV